MKQFIWICGLMVFLSWTAHAEAQYSRHSWRPPSHYNSNVWAGSPAYRNYNRGYTYQPRSYYVIPPAYGAYPHASFYAPGAFNAGPMFGPSFGFGPSYNYQYQYQYWYGF